MAPGGGFAKTDPDFKQLLSHDNPKIQTLAAARVGHRSSQAESRAERFLALSELRVNLGDIEISLTEGRLSGRASAECILTDVRTGEVHTMDFNLRIENGSVSAKLVPRKFWQFWK